MSGLILVIDDEELLCKQINKALNQEGYNVLSSFTGKEGLSLATTESPDLVILDLKLPDIDGLSVFKKMQTLDPSPNVIMMTAHGNIELAVSAIKLGAYDFLEKPFPLHKLKVMVRNALSAIELKANLNAATLREQERHGFSSLIGDSDEINDVISLISKLVDSTPRMVLISGESGTGKGLAAKVLHFNGNRAEKPFIELNCAAIPETLLESELFGNEAGAFTDAKKMKKGLFEQADGGTIFLDEIGDMSLTLQAKLVKVIEEQTLRRIGGVRYIKVDLTVVAATNCNLKDLVSKKLFREDLYHRLNVINIEMPPLRKRKQDIEELTDYFIDYFNGDLRKNINIMPREIREAFKRYNWPGNVRELKSTIERAMLLSEGNILNPKYIQLDESDAANMKFEESTDIVTLEIPINNVSLPKIEENVIRKALDINDWNQTRTARMLGVTREVLRYRMKKWGMLT